MKVLRWLATSAIVFAAAPLAAASMGVFSPQRLADIEDDFADDSRAGASTRLLKPDRQLHHRPVPPPAFSRAAIWSADSARTQDVLLSRSLPVIRR
jgi:hypothetical protein